MSSPPQKQTPRKQHFDSPEQEVFLNLWRTYDRLKALEDELFTGFDLSAQQYNALRLLRSVYPAGMQTLALGKRLISRAPDITRLVDKLHRRGLVERQRLADNRRVVELSITEAGIELLDKLAPAVLELHRQQLGHLEEGELEGLANLLRQARKPHEDSTCDWLDEQPE